MIDGLAVPMREATVPGHYEYQSNENSGKGGEDIQFSFEVHGASGQ